MIAEFGYAGTGVRMIAAGLGASPASLFNLFANKDEILNGLIAYMAAPSLAFYEEMKGVQPPAAALYKMVHDEVLLVASADRAFPALFYLPELRRPQFEAARQTRRDLIACYQHQIVAGVADSSLTCARPALAAEQVFQLTETCILMEPDAEIPAPRELARLTARFALRGLLRSPAMLDEIETQADRLTAKIQPHTA